MRCGEASETDRGPFRPLTVATFRLNRALAGRLDPVALHATNVALHAAASVAA